MQKFKIILKEFFLAPNRVVVVGASAKGRDKNFVIGHCLDILNSSQLTTISDTLQ